MKEATMERYTVELVLNGGGTQVKTFKHFDEYDEYIQSLLDHGNEWRILAVVEPDYRWQAPDRKARLQRAEAM